MDKVLDIGVDGFKCDGTDPFAIELLPARNYKGRVLGLHQYGHEYYGNFYNHSKSKNPEALIMSRPVDCVKKIHCWAFSPKYVMFAGWVGDQDSSA